MKKVLVCLLALLALAGCSLQQRMASAADTLVANYCQKTPSERAVVRLWIDEATSPNKIRVQCASDGEINDQATPPVNP